MEYDHEGGDAGLFAFASLAILFVFVLLGGLIYVSVQRVQDERDLENHLEGIGFVDAGIYGSVVVTTLGSCKVELETGYEEPLVVWYRSPVNDHVRLRISDAADLHTLRQLPEMQRCY